MSDEVIEPPPKTGVKVLKLRPEAVLPKKATVGSAGYDLVSTEYHLIDPGTWTAVGTGLAVEMQSWQELQIRPRSGLAAKHGVTVLNAPGTVDADYRGEIKVLLFNHGREPFEVCPGDRIAQAVLGCVTYSQALELGEAVDELSGTSRGTGGFGSTGA